MSRLKVKVRRKHIENGIFGSISECPIALALGDQGYPDARVHSNNASYHDGAFLVSAQLSRSATRFVRSFDHGRKVKPFNFYLTID